MLSQSRNSNKSLNQKPWRNTDFQLSLNLILRLSWPSYICLGILSHNGLYPSLTISNQVNPPQASLIWEITCCRLSSQMTLAVLSQKLKLARTRSINVILILITIIIFMVNEFSKNGHFYLLHLSTA